MALNKATISGVAAVASLAILAGGGFLATVGAFSSTLDTTKQTIANYLNYNIGLAKVDPVSVEILEPDFGLFSRDLLLVIANKEQSFKLPIKANLGFLSYDFDLDLVNARYNEENLLKYHNFDKLTALEGRANYKVVSSLFNLELNASYLNVLEDFANHSLTTEEKTELKQDLLAKDVGNASFIMSIKDMDSIKTSIKIDSLVTEDLAISNVNFYNEYAGLYTFTDLGKTYLSFDNFVYDKYLGLPIKDQIIKHGLFKVEASRLQKNGKFDLNYLLSLSNVDMAKDINLSGKLSNLNVSLFERAYNGQPVLGLNLDAFDPFSYFLKTPVSFTIDKGSSFKLSAETRADKYADIVNKDILFNLNSSIDTKIDESNEVSAVEGSITLDSIEDVQTIVDSAFIGLHEYFKVNNKGNSQSSIKFKLSSDLDDNFVEINGERL